MPQRRPARTSGSSSSVTRLSWVARMNRISSVHVRERRREDQHPDRADHRRAGAHAQPQRAHAALGLREAQQRVAREQAHGDRRHREVARQDREPEHARADERHDAADQQRARDQQPPPAEVPPREVRADRGEQRDRRAHGGADERHERPGHVLDPAHAPEILGERARGLDRVDRVAGDDQVRERPDDRRDEDDRQVTQAPLPQPPEAREHPRLGAQQAGEDEQDGHAAAVLGGEHARPDDEREERRVHVAARGVEQERGARGDEQRRQRAAPAPEHRRAQAVGPEHERRVREEAQQHERAVRRSPRTRGPGRPPPRCRAGAASARRRPRTTAASR